MCRIRAHHFLCLSGFQSFGYSDDFTDNMGKIKSELLDNNTAVEIVRDCDDICSCCPHKKAGVCGKEGAVPAADMDKSVLEKLGFDENLKIKAAEVFNRIKEKMKKTNDLLSVCAGCQWHKKCLFFTSKGEILWG